MYKLYLYCSHLMRRRLILACVVVMLGVITFSVVKSVMNPGSLLWSARLGSGGHAEQTTDSSNTRLRDRLHGLFSDIIIEARTPTALQDPAKGYPSFRTTNSFVTGSSP